MSKELDRDLFCRRALGWSLACREIPPRVDLGCDPAMRGGDIGSELARVEDIDALNHSQLTRAVGSARRPTRRLPLRGSPL
jgi:hypothetical protein